MSLVGNMIATSAQGDPAIVNYDMFVAIFAMGSLLYLILATFVERVYHGKVVFGLEALNALFFFCGAVATASYLGVHSCSNIVSWAPTLGTNIKLTRHVEIHKQQLRDKRFTQHAQTLHRGASFNRVPLLRLLRLCRILCAVIHALNGWRQQQRRKLFPTRTSNEPGLKPTDCTLGVKSR